MVGPPAGVRGRRSARLVSPEASSLHLQTAAFSLSHVAAPVCVSFCLFFYEEGSAVGWSRATLMTSFYLNHLLKALTPHTVTFRGPGGEAFSMCT